MNTQQIENQKIWKEIKGAEKLFEIYEYFPTLHDARIKKIEVNLERREFYLTVEYSDMIGESDKSIETRFTIFWRNVQKANFNWYAEDLDGMEFSRAGDFIKTTFEDAPYDFEGEMLSGEIEIINIEIEPEKDENNRGTIKFSIN